jgi:CRISPR/Cas system-associated exonuclease Cas4 (RecB family)
MSSNERTPRRIIVATAAATRVAEARAWLDAYAAAAEVLVVGASWDAADDLVRAAALAQGARFGTTRLTLGTLAGILATPTLAAAALVPAGGLSLDAIAARAVHALAMDDALAYFTPIARCPGFPRAVARTVEELRMACVDAAALRRGGDVGAAMSAIMAAIEREIADAGVADRAAVFAAACDAVARGTPSPLLGVPLLLLDVPVQAEREAALVAALARRAPAVLATAAAGDERTIVHLEHALAIRRDMVAARARHSLANLQTHLFEDSAPPERDLDARVVLRSWPGEARECVEIARGIQAEAQRGVAFDRMAIFLPAQHDYTSHLDEALRRAEVPAFFATGTTRPDAAGRALLALLGCAADGLSARRFAEYLSLGQVPQPDVQAARAAAPDTVWAPPEHDLVAPVIADAIGGAAPEPAVDDPLPADPEREPVVDGVVRTPWRWEQLLVDAAVIGRKERWGRRLAGLEAELRLRRDALVDEDEARAARAERALADVGHLRAFALPLIERLAALPERARWGEWLDHLRALAAVALRDPEHVLAALAELAPMAPVGPIELDEVRLVLTERLRELRDRPSRRRYGAVFVAPAHAARGLVFDVVFVAGLAERIVPRKITEDPILLDASRRALAPTLATQPDRVAAERLALRLAVGAARERVVLSYPRLDMAQGRPRVPSFYTLEALRAAEGPLPSFEEIARRARGEGGARLGWPAPERCEDAIDDAEYDLALLAPLLDADPETTRGTARYLLGANPHLARALRARARRWWRSRWTPADGLVDVDEVGRAALARHQLAARSFSPTALQNFAACPYRFFLQAVHRLQPREEPIALEALDPLTRGALFHDVQYALLTKLRAEGRLPVTRASCEDCQNAVDGVLAEVAAAYREKLAPAIARVWDDGIAGVRADLREWLRLAAEDDGGWVPHRFELSFGIADRDRANADPASTPEPVAIGGGLKLRGAIDLVERHARGRVRVTDHKTGKVRARPGVVVGGGEILQPVLYALACERLLPEPVAAGRLYYCTAAGGYEERVVPLDDTSRAAAATVTAIVDRALREGFLPAAPAARACVYCDYRSVCGPYEEVRTKRKPADRLQDLARLRSMP